MHDRGNEAVDAGVGVRPHLNPARLDLFEPKSAEYVFIMLILCAVVGINYYDGFQESACDASCIRNRHELSNIWIAGIAGSLMSTFSILANGFSDLSRKKQLTNLAFLLEIVQHGVCNFSACAPKPGADMSSWSDSEKYAMSQLFAILSVLTLLVSNFVKIDIFGILDQGRFRQKDITLGHNIGTFGYSGYILNLAMHSSDRYERWKILLVAACIQVVARVRIVYCSGNTNGGRLGRAGGDLVDSLEQQGSGASASDSGLPVAEPVGLPADSTNLGDTSGLVVQTELDTDVDGAQHEAVPVELLIRVRGLLTRQQEQQGQQEQHLMQSLLPSAGRG